MQGNTSLQAGQKQRADLGRRPPAGTPQHPLPKRFLSFGGWPCRALPSFFIRAGVCGGGRIDKKAGAVAQVMSRFEGLILLRQPTRGAGVNTFVRSLTTHQVPSGDGSPERSALQSIARPRVREAQKGAAVCMYNADTEERGLDTAREFCLDWQEGEMRVGVQSKEGFACVRGFLVRCRTQGVSDPQWA